MNARAISSAFSRVVVGRRNRGVKCHLFLEHADAAGREHDGHGEHAFPPRSGRVDVIHQAIAPFALVSDLERLLGLERRIHHVAQRLAGVDDRAMTRLLCEGALNLATRLQADAGAA
jgi:hypothetical protein